MTLGVHDGLPVAWHQARIPIPVGDNVETFAERLGSRLLRRWDRPWAWAPGESAEMVIAAPYAGDLAVLLAHVLGITKEGAGAAQLSFIDQVLGTPHEHAAAIRSAARSLWRLQLVSN